MGRKRCAFEINLCVKKLDDVDLVEDSKDSIGEEETGKELSKIMDAVWERYPEAQVAKTTKLANSSSIVFEIG